MVTHHSLLFPSFVLVLQVVRPVAEISEPVEVKVAASNVVVAGIDAVVVVFDVEDLLYSSTSCQWN
jgi:hypothetical protein